MAGNHLRLSLTDGYQATGQPLLAVQLQLCDVTFAIDGSVPEPMARDGLYPKWNES